MTATKEAKRCGHCGSRVPPPKPLARICAKCRKPIAVHHKWKLVQVKQKRPQYEFHHRHCGNPEGYLP